MATERRLIDANAVPKLFEKKYEETEQRILDGETYLDTLAEGFTEADDVILSMPTVDAVEVVRCKDCKYCTVQQMQIPGDVEFRQFPVCVCEHPRGEVGSEPLYMLTDDFCSYGERRTNVQITD